MFKVKKKKYKHSKKQFVSVKYTNNKILLQTVRNA